MKRLIPFTFITVLLIFFLCSVPNNPADDYANSTVSVALDSISAGNTGIYTDTLGNQISFKFYRKFSQHINSFSVDFDDGAPVVFTTKDYLKDTIAYSHKFQSVGHKVLNVTVYYTNNTNRFIDSVAIIDIVNLKPVFNRQKPDSIFPCDDSGSIVIPIKVSGGNTSKLVFRITDQNLPESSTVNLVGDTSLFVFVPKNNSGAFHVEVQVSDTIDSVRTMFNFKVIDNTPPLPPIFASPALVTTTTPKWSWITGGNGGCGIYRYNLDNDNLSNTTYSEKKTTFFQPPVSLSEGLHTLFIQERDSSGNWSEPSSWAITIDATAPIAPTVSGTTPTNNQKPTWNWSSSNNNDPHFRYKLDSANFSPTDTVSTKTTIFTPVTDLSEGKHTLYVQESDNAGNWSATGSFTITVDLTGPQAPTVIAATPTANRRPVWTWTSNGGGAKGDFRCMLDTNAFDSSFATSALMYIAPKDLSEGNHTLFVQESDSAGNWSVAGSFAVLIDISAPNPPTVNVISISNNRTPIWSWTTGGGGNGTFRYKLDSDDLSSGATANTSTSFTPPTELSEGLHTFYIQERDSTGNWSSVVSKGSTVDFTPPAKPVISGSILTNNPLLSWTWKSGGSGNGKFRLKIDSNDMSNGAINVDTNFYTSTSTLGEGNHNLFLQERDEAGNWSSSDSFLTTIDLTPPVAPIVVGVDISNNTQPTWSWSSGSGGTGEFRYQLDSATFSIDSVMTTSTSFTSVINLSEGDHIFYVQERDAAGNWSASGSFKTKIDISAAGVPSVTGVSPTNDSTPTWSWKSGGGSKHYRYKLNDTTLSSGATLTTDSVFTPTIHLTEGPHTLYVQEDDGSGNWSSKGSFVIQTDFTPPSPPIVKGISPTSNKKPTWTWGDAEIRGILETKANLAIRTLKKYRYKFNSNDFSSGVTSTSAESYTPLTDLAEQAHTLYVQEGDAAGNWSKSGSFTIVIDLTKPNTPAVSGASPTNNMRPKWTWLSAGGNGTFRYKLDDTTLTSGATTVTTLEYTPGTNLTEAAHTLYVQEQDNAGNWSSSGSKTIVIDITPGNPPIISGPTSTNKSTPTWTWQSGGGKGYYIYRLDYSDIEGAPSYTTTNSFTPSSPLSEGTHVLYVREQDLAGNWSASSWFAITVDLTKPAIPIFNTGTTLSPAFSKNVTWAWQMGIGGNGYYNYKLDNGAWSGETTATSYTASLGDGMHTLYVKQRDAAGNWSDSTFRVIDVFPAPTNLRIILTGNVVTVSWIDNTSAESNYQLYLTTNPTYDPYNHTDVVNAFQINPNVTSVSLGASHELCQKIYYHLFATRSDGLRTATVSKGTGCEGYPPSP